MKEIIIFRIGKLKCALDIMQAQEINRNLEITDVPESPDYLRGVANLRGKLLTIIDLRVIFGLEPQRGAQRNQVIVLSTTSEETGLLVDDVDDIVSVNEENLHAPTANLSGVPGDFFKSIYRTDGDIAALISLDRVLSVV